MEELLKEYEEAQNRVNEIKNKLRNFEDGYEYLTIEYVYGSRYKKVHRNEFCAQELTSEYCGDNGIVEVYTTNDKHNFRNYTGGGTTVLTEKEFKDLLIEHNIK